jgi:hypothetical protein
MRGLGVLEDVTQRLLGDPEQNRLDAGRETQVRIRVERDFETRRRKR